MSDNQTIALGLASVIISKSLETDTAKLIVLAIDTYEKTLKILKPKPPVNIQPAEPSKEDNKLSDFLNYNG